MAHNPRKRTHQLGVEVKDSFLLIFFTVNVDGLKEVSNHFRSTLEVAIKIVTGFTPDCYR